CHNGVGSPGGAIDQQLSRGQQSFARELQLTGRMRNRTAYSFESAIRRRQRLSDGEGPTIVADHHIGERPAGIDRNTVAHQGTPGTYRGAAAALRHRHTYTQHAIRGPASAERSAPASAAEIGPT